MKVTFNTYPMAFDTPGGGEMQLMAYRKFLPEFGVHPVLFDLWNPQLDETDLVHFFSTIAGSYHFCAHVKKAGLPLIVTSSLWITPQTKHLYPHEEIAAQLSLADQIVTNSRLEAESLANTLQLEKTKFSVVYNGCEESFLVKEDPSLFRKKFNVDGPFILNVGNIEPRKNQLRLLQAAKRASDLPLVMIGYARDEAYLNECLAGGAGKAIYLGPLQHNSRLLRSAMSACELFALPSTLETPGLSALEAAAQGANIVITNQGSAWEYFGDTVTYLDPSDVIAMAEAIRSALDYTTKSDAAFHVVKNHFTWRNVVPALAKTYAEVVLR